MTPWMSGAPRSPSVKCSRCPVPMFRAVAHQLAARQPVDGRLGYHDRNGTLTLNPTPSRDCS